ncbi:MAG: 3D domain-containing protein [Agathobaculum sp.]|uniref:3D domain-containing protein n=1 Tax=Agathobaculum sp. TaxID=2048138 RepID=UPI0025C012C2|nr:3D domain-containing protein [Agathobaculum sp.]MDY3712454.1 3D domain-containing protein [Agathobaculum sp.]
MSFSLRKHASQLIAAALAVGTIATIGAAALDQPVAVLSSNLNSSVGTVLTSEEILSAEQALSKSKAVADTKANTAASTKANTTAAAKTDDTTNTKVDVVSKAEADALAYNDLLTAPINAKSVAYSSDLLATDLIKSRATAMGNYKLTFYCPCEICNGHSHATTASGTTMTEGRTIAVDPSVIPLGSRVYVDGYGVFIAEDTGGAIIGNKIDIGVSSHTRAYELGIKYADVYLLG